MAATRSPAVDVAKQHLNGKEPDGPVLLSTGVRAIVRPVSITLISEVQAQVKDPPVPLQTIEGRDNPVENPLDPDYLEAKAKADQKRGQAVMDAMILFGIELVDPIPDDDTWLKKLRFLEKQKRIDLSGYDLDEPIERDFVYKRFVAVTADDLSLVGRMSGVQGEDVRQARESFQG